MIDLPDLVLKQVLDILFVSDPDAILVLGLVSKAITKRINSLDYGMFTRLGSLETPFSKLDLKTRVSNPRHIRYLSITYNQYKQLEISKKNCPWLKELTIQFAPDDSNFVHTSNIHSSVLEISNEKIDHWLKLKMYLQSEFKDLKWFFVSKKGESVATIKESLNLSSMKRLFQIGFPINEPDLHGYTMIQKILMARNVFNPIELALEFLRLSNYQLNPSTLVVAILEEDQIELDLEFFIKFKINVDLFGNIIGPGSILLKEYIECGLKCMNQTLSQFEIERLPSIDFAYSGQSLLSIACSTGQRDITEYLVSKGAKQKFLNNDALKLALLSEQYSICSVLLEHGFNLNFCLESAVLNIEQIYWLLANGYRITGKLFLFNLGIFFANCSDLGLVKYCLGRIYSLISVNYQDCIGNTALHYSSVTSPALVQWLMDKKANVNIANSKRQTPLNMCCSLPLSSSLCYSKINQRTFIDEIAHILCSYDADVEIADEFEQTPVITAIKNGHFQVYSYLFGIIGASMTHKDLLQQDGYFYIRKILSD